MTRNYLVGREMSAAGQSKADLIAALEACISVIDDYLAYRHDGDPTREDARLMGEMEINRFAQDGRLEAALAALASEPDPQPVAEEERLDRLEAAIEGELDGLAITREKARIILAYVETGEVPASPHQAETAPDQEGQTDGR